MEPELIACSIWPARSFIPAGGGGRLLCPVPAGGGGGANARGSGGGTPPCKKGKDEVAGRALLGAACCARPASVTYGVTGACDVRNGADGTAGC